VRLESFHNPPFGIIFSDQEDTDGEEFVGDGLLREDSVPSRSKPDWQTLTPDELSKKMFEIVDDVNAIFQVSECH
jgi:hypothetical protein